MGDLHQWLEGIGLGQYADMLIENDIDRETILLLGDEEFDKLGISLGHRKALIKAAAAFRPPDWPSPDRRGPARLADAKAERRHLTVLFCDIVGSTKLSAKLDPEDLAVVLREFQGRCSAAITHYDGHVARLMGDGVLAYFGFPAAHEDNAERAVNAALEMVAAISASPLCATHDIKVRIGIASGIVIVGDLMGEGPAAEFALVGEAPNRAARLQQRARPNQILVCPATRRLLGSRFVLKDGGEHALKGFERRVRVWQVLRSNAVESRFVARQASPLTRFVGRDRELALLDESYQTAERGNGQLVLISGEPGIGKSRLAMALLQRLRPKAGTVLSFQCSSYHTSSAWHPVIRHLEDAAGIAPDSPPAARLQKLQALIGRYLAGDSSECVAVLAALMNVPLDDRYPRPALTSKQLKLRTFAVLLALFRAHAKERPAVIVFDDAHWIDPTSLELLERLRDDVQDRRMLVLVLFRPELITLPWTDHPHVAALTLNRLHKAQVAAMIEALAGQEPLSRATVDQIAAKTDGVPLFVEELTKVVLETGDCRTLDAADSPGIVPPLPVPETLHDSLMARLDQLASVKTIAQTAAVIGREFRLDLLEAIATQPRSEVHAAIDRLLASGLLYRSGHPGDHNFTFKHTMVQEVAYGSLLNAERRQLHGRIASALSRQFVQIAEPELVAHHCTRAGQTMDAIGYWYEAGRQSSDRSAFVEASTHLRNALGLAVKLPATPERDKLELELQYSLGSALAAWKGFGNAETRRAFMRSLELSDRFEPSTQAFSVLNGVIGVHVAHGEFEQSRRFAEELLVRARRQNDTTARVMGHRALGMSLLVIGELPAARIELQNAADLYDAAVHGPLAHLFSQDLEVTALAYMGLAAALQFDIGDALKYGRDAVAHAEELRHPHSLCYALAFQAGVHLLWRDADAVDPLASRCAAVAEEHGFTQWIAAGQMLSGWARLERGDARGALADIRRSVETMEQTGAQIWVQFTRYLLASALIEAGENGEAAEVVDHELLKLARTSGRWYEAEFHRLRGSLLRARGDLAAAEAGYGTAIAVAERQGASLLQLRAENDLASLRQSQGRHDEARARLAPLYASLGNDVASKDMMVTKMLLGETGKKGSGRARS
jgi:class 3 adenylate cyclase/predicted ATPase/energy-coupling factor transporter ATP-binding protein EcfA2